jgi:exo-beta-1,3-glucanase (GH17 family)
VLTSLAGRDHKHLHQRQADLSGSVVTVTRTVVEPSAVIWVDDAGNTISTEIRALSPTTAPDANPQPAPAAFAANANVAANPEASPASTATASASTPTSTGGGYGICYDMINAASQCKSADQISKDFAFLAQNGYTQVRTYDIGCDVGVVVQQAAANGLRVFAGINGVANVAGDLAKLIGYINGNWANVDTINIGNEQVNQGAATVEQVNAAVTAGRGILQAAGFKGSVVTVDVFNTFTTNPQLGSTSDYIAANVSLRKPSQ